MTQVTRMMWLKIGKWRLPVLKIKDRGDHGRRTKDILGGPKSLETKKFGLSKGWGDQSAEKTNNWRVKKYLTNRWGTNKLRTNMSLVEFVEIYALFGRTKRTKNLRWEAFQLLEYQWWEGKFDINLGQISVWWVMIVGGERKHWTHFGDAGGLLVWCNVGCTVTNSSFKFEYLLFREVQW